jgi:hypothetical protein
VPSTGSFWRACGREGRLPCPTRWPPPRHSGMIPPRFGAAMPLVTVDSRQKTRAASPRGWPGWPRHSVCAARRCEVAASSSPVCSDRPTALNHANEDHHNREHEKKVNKPAHGVGRNHSQQPQDQQNYRHSPQHVRALSLVGDCNCDSVDCTSNRCLVPSNSYSPAPARRPTLVWLSPAGIFPVCRASRRCPSFSCHLHRALARNVNLHKRQRRDGRPMQHFTKRIKARPVTRTIPGILGGVPAHNAP